MTQEILADKPKLNIEDSMQLVNKIVQSLREVRDIQLPPELHGVTDSEESDEETPAVPHRDRNN